MKKIIALLLVCLMVVPFGMLATTSISAAGKTIYVSDAGDDTAAGDAAAPVKTIVKASELVGAEGGIGYCYYKRRFHTCSSHRHSYHQGR